MEEANRHSTVVEMACEAECRVCNAAAKQDPCLCPWSNPVSACRTLRHWGRFWPTVYVVQLLQLACILLLTTV